MWRVGEREQACDHKPTIEGTGGDSQDSQIIGQPLWVYVVGGSPLSPVVLTNEALSLVSGMRQ